MLEFFFENRNDKIRMRLLSQESSTLWQGRCVLSHVTPRNCPLSLHYRLRDEVNKGNWL